MAVSREQASIIAAPVADILVSAAAGSGKTYTMTHRIVERVKAKKLSLDRVLVLTFTEKAADNMRSRMAQVLHEALVDADQTDKSYLIEQEMRLNAADISTVHAFCQKIIKAHGHDLHLTKSTLWPDADATPMEGEEQKRLLRQAIDECLNEAYAEADARFLAGEEGEEALIWQLSDAFGDGKGDEPLCLLLGSVHGFLRSMPDYEKWVAEALADYQSVVANFEQSPMVQYYYEHLERLWKRAMQGVSLMRPILEQDDPPLFKAMAKFKAETYAENEATRQQYLQLLNEIEHLQLSASKRPSWDEIHAAGMRMVLPDIRRAGKNPEKLLIIDAARCYLGEFLHFINGSCRTASYTDQFLWGQAPVFDFAKATIVEELAGQSARLEAFFELLLRCDQRYAELKNEAHKIDFSDMEHLALVLVRQPEVKALYTEKFKEIYIDEYQDTSSIQDCIVMELAKDNLFVVGDIKQSIYRFRHANPRLFATRYEEMKGKSSQQLFELSTNYRSTPAVLRAVNLLFAELMTKEASEIDYLAGHSLGIPKEKLAIEVASEKHEADRAAMNFLVYTDSREAYEEALTRELQDKTAAEGLAIATEMLKLINAGVKPSDIAILSRNHQDLKNMAALLSLLGIEYSYTKEQRLLNSRILRCLIALLRILENPLQDNYLATVLLHFEPWGMFSEQDLLKIKLASLEGEDALRFEQPFHRAMMRYLEQGKDVDLKERLRVFWHSFLELRKRSLNLNLTQIVRVIYEDLGLLKLAAREQEPELKKEQLELFAHWAESFVKVGQNSLYAMNAELLSQDDQIELTEKSLEEEAQGVSLMTFHGSKGLEFPYVFLIHTDAATRAKESKKLVYAQAYGVASVIAEDEALAAHRSLLQRYIESKEEDANLAEQLRLFYVALTRAEKCLYLSLSLDNIKNALAFVETAWELALDEIPASPAVLPSCLIRQAAKKNLAALSFLALKKSGSPFWPVLVEASTTLVDSVQGDLAIIFRDSMDLLQSQDTSGFEAKGVQRPIGKQSATSRSEEPLLQRFKLEMEKEPAEARYWSMNYPFGQAIRTGIKYSVSEIKEQVYQKALLADEEPSAASAPFVPRDNSRMLRPLKDLMDSDLTLASRTLNAAERGSALHKILRYLRPSDYETLTEIEALERLQSVVEAYAITGFLSEGEKDAIVTHLTSLLAYLMSPRAREIAACERELSGKVYREIPFTLAWSASDLLQDFNGKAVAEQDKVLVQGIVDLWYALGDKAVVLDFKTDRIAGSEEEVLAELQRRYGKQLELYALAVERELGAPVSERVIWLLSRDKEYRLS